jgi:hypothetical protein
MKWMKLCGSLRRSFRCCGGTEDGDFSEAATVQKTVIFSDAATAQKTVIFSDAATAQKTVFFPIPRRYRRLRVSFDAKSGCFRREIKMNRKRELCIIPS